MHKPTVFISADHGLALVYFMQTEVQRVLRSGGLQLVLLTDDDLIERIAERFGETGVIVEGMRLPAVREYEKVAYDLQWWLGFLRRVGGSNRINTEAMDSYVEQVLVEASPRQIPALPIAWILLALLRRSQAARRWLHAYQQRFTPDIYGDLFERYQPSLVIGSTPGWRQDRYLLREAARRGIRTASVIVGWDNPSSYSLPGAPVDNITCWSKIQEQELIMGSDWSPDQIHIGGIPIYDGYFEKRWLLERSEYFNLHGLDPSRKLLSYASSFVSFSPNFQNIQALGELVSSGELAEPAQLLIRLHPNHFWDNWLFQDERQRIHRYAEEHEHIHVVEPVPIGGELGYYSGEDMPEKASMMAYADVFLTVYSTMVVEAAVHDRPIVSVCIDAPRGWGYVRKLPLRKYSLPLSKIGDWPTHDRFRRSGAGEVVFSKEQLRTAVNAYLKDPRRHQAERRSFVEREVSFTDGSAGRRTGEYLLQLAQQAAA